MNFIIISITIVLTLQSVSPTFKSIINPFLAEWSGVQQNASRNLDLLYSRSFRRTFSHQISSIFSSIDLLPPIPNSSTAAWVRLPYFFGLKSTDTSRCDDPPGVGVSQIPPNSICQKHKYKKTFAQAFSYCTICSKWTFKID